MIKPKIKQVFILLILASFLIACDSSKLTQTPMENFIGTWEVKGRSMFDGIVIRIDKNNNDEYIGRVKEINENKYVKMFVEPNDIWFYGIKRSSNFEFKLSEKKLASELFSMYGLSSKVEYRVQFIDKNTIGLGQDSDPIKSGITYKRVD